MKKFFRGGLAAALLLTGATAAQAQISFGPKVGLNLANIHSKYTGDADGVDEDNDTKMAIGPAFGLMLNARFGNISIQPSLLYSQKGYKNKGTQTTTLLTTTTKTENDVTTTLQYVDIPINLVYTTGGDQGFQVFVGPYVAFGIGGKTKGDVTTSTTIQDEGTVTTKVSVDTDVKFGSKDDQTKSLDFGLNAGLGYLVNNFQIQAGYGLGLGNLNNGDLAKDFKTNNRVIHFTVGYLFNAN